MEEVINEGEVVTPEVEATLPENKSYEAGDPAALRGSTEDGTIYDMTSPAVLDYQAKITEVTDIKQVIGSILNMHNIIARGETPAGEGNETILEAIKANLPAKE